MVMPPSVAPPDRTRGVARILLVDDVLALIELQRSYLKRTTCRVLTARSAGQALEICRQERPDVVFLDAEMPGVNGREACRALKDDPLLRGIPVVLVAPEELRDEATRAGCDDVLPKPVTHVAFLECVRRYVALLERQEDRIPASVRVTFEARGRAYAAYTKDVSPHGVFLKSPRPFTLGTRLRLRIHLPDGGEALPAEGEVKRVIARRAGSHFLPGIGIAFADLPPESETRLVRFIRGRKPR